jgi:hypothetical protein
MSRGLHQIFIELSENFSGFQAYSLAPFPLLIRGCSLKKDALSPGHRRPKEDKARAAPIFSRSGSIVSLKSPGPAFAGDERILKAPPKSER